MIFNTDCNFWLVFVIAIIIPSVPFSILLARYIKNKKIRYSLISYTVVIVSLIIYMMSTNQSFDNMKISESPAIVKIYEDSVVVIDSITNESRTFTYMTDFNFLKSGNFKICYYKGTNTTFPIHFNIGTFGKIEKK